MFLEGKIAMHLSGRWLVPKYKDTASFDWDVINFPRYASPIDASGWAISKQTKSKDAAVKFVLFLSKKENICKMTEGGLILPARLDVAYSKEFLKTGPKHSEIFLDTAKNSEITTVTKDCNKITDKLNDENFSKY